MKATAVAPANIAFIKYWGRRENRIPHNPSISMNLSSCFSTTTVEFSKDFRSETVKYVQPTKNKLELEFSGFEKQRIIAHVNRLQAIARKKFFVKIETTNSFPRSSGIASSASGFAALTIATTAALGLKLSEQELSKLARLGSGSAARSIPDGFVKWEGEFGYSLYPASYWDLRDIIVIVTDTAKEVSSSVGHDTASTSPYFAKRLQSIPGRVVRLEQALKEKNFKQFGEVIEEECLDMHHVMETQTPSLHYLSPETKKIIKQLQKRTVPAYFTIDAGPNVHVICEAGNEEKITDMFKKYFLIVNKPTIGAHLL